MAKIAQRYGRSVEEWVGKTPDAPVPEAVQLRIWERQGGVDPIAGRKIMPGEPKHLDHIIPLWKGGEHRESNLQWLLGDETHKAKTSEEATERAKVKAVAKRHVGIKKAKAPIPQRPKAPRPDRKQKEMAALGPPRLGRL